MRHFAALSRFIGGSKAVSRLLWGLLVVSLFAMPLLAIAQQPTLPSSADNALLSAQPVPLSAKSALPSGKLVAITFDDGPAPVVTERILDILERYRCKATFFVVGWKVKDGAQTLRRMVSLGMEIGNHTSYHRDLRKFSTGSIRNDVEKTNTRIKEVIGFAPMIVRPPYGRQNSRVRRAVPYPLVRWSLDTLDWHSQDKDKIFAAVLDKVNDGDIILFHDTHMPTADAIEAIIPALLERGYTLVTVDELMAARGISMVAGNSYQSGK